MSPFRLVLLVVFVGLACASQRRARSEPNEWFVDLVLEDQQHASHDNSGEAAVIKDRLCCQRVSFVEDPYTQDILSSVQVPYNYWWKRGGMLLSVSKTLDEPSNRLLTIDRAGLELDFTRGSRLYVRLQCAFPCCLEAAEFLVPDGAQPLQLVGANETHSVQPWRLDQTKRMAPGYVRMGDHRLRHEMMWTDEHFVNRIDAQHLCDHATNGAWIQIDSPSRVTATMTELDLCFVHHSIAADWESSLCSEY